MGIVKNMLFPKTPKQPDNSILLEQQKRADEKEKAMKDEEAKFRRIGQMGRGSLIMTSGMGIEDNATVMKRTLGGA